MIASSLFGSVISGALLRIASISVELLGLAIAALSTDGLTDGLATVLAGLTTGLTKLADGLTEGLADGLAAEGLTTTIGLAEAVAADPVEPGVGVAEARELVTAEFAALG